MNGKRAKALRRAARALAQQPSTLEAQLHERAKLVRTGENVKPVGYTAVTARYPNLCSRRLYQRMKKLVARHGGV